MKASLISTTRPSVSATKKGSWIEPRIARSQEASRDRERARTRLDGEARPQLGGLEGLGDVVVCTLDETGRAGLHPGAGRQEHDGHPAQALVGTDLAHELQTVHARHHDVGQHDVDRRVEAHPHECFDDRPRPARRRSRRRGGARCSRACRRCPRRGAGAASRPPPGPARCGARSRRPELQLRRRRRTGAAPSRPAQARTAGAWPASIERSAQLLASEMNDSTGLGLIDGLVAESAQRHPTAAAG